MGVKVFLDLLGHRREQWFALGRQAQARPKSLPGPVHRVQA